MKKIVVCLATGGALVSVPAMAQSVDATFTGPRVEALVGYDVTEAGSSVDNDFDDDVDESIDGFLYGIGAGYDFDLGGIVVGAEAELTDSTAKSGFDRGSFEDIGLGNVRTNRDIYLGARVGARMGPQMLLYAKGGYTNAKFDVDGWAGPRRYDHNIKADGWRIGAGAEYAMTEQMFVKLEYRYSNYEKAEIDFGGAIPDSERFDIDLDRHQVVAGVGLRF